MKNILVVEDPTPWSEPTSGSDDAIALPGAELVSAESYLTTQAHANLRRTRVFNLCEDYGYQRTGYYVSLLAEARGHRPLPSILTLQDFRDGVAPVELATSGMQALLDRALAPIVSDRFVLSIYFGRNLAKRYDRLSHALFARFPSPLLRAEAHRTSGPGESRRWRLSSLRPIALREVPDEHRPFLVEQAQRFFARPRVKEPRRIRADLAVLVDPGEVAPPSNALALERFERAARRLGIRVTTVTADDIGRLGQFDGLFIRTTTAVNHYTYRFARRAQTEGAVVIDDAGSIVRCTNKVYQAELFERHGVSAPATRILHAGHLDRLDEHVESLGLPFVLKQPDSAFSKGVSKVGSIEEAATRIRELLTGSELVVAQSFLRSDFDWRVGVLGGRVLWVCRYYYPKGHWQISQHREGRPSRHGRHETVSPDAAPAPVLDTALRAAALIGDGLYGVDLKEIDGRAFVVEVNDNPNLDAGVEDSVGKDAVYRAIAGHFLERIEARSGSHPR